MRGHLYILMRMRMRMRMPLRVALLLAFLLPTVAGGAGVAGAGGSATAQREVAAWGSAFADTWARTDRPVAELAAGRTWLWGPEAFTPGLLEPYAEGADGQRVVQYYDKSRMEISTVPGVGADSPWYVTNGLLALELITGRMQTGDAQWEHLAPAEIPVAGDPDDAAGPTYATFNEPASDTSHGAGRFDHPAHHAQRGAGGRPVVGDVRRAGGAAGDALGYRPQRRESVLDLHDLRGPHLDRRWLSHRTAICEPLLRHRVPGE